MNKIDFISNEVPPLIKAYVEMTEPLNQNDVHKSDIKSRQKEVLKKSVTERRSMEVKDTWNGNMPVICNTQTLTPLQQYSLAHSIFDNTFDDLH